MRTFMITIVIIVMAVTAYAETFDRIVNATVTNVIDGDTVDLVILFPGVRLDPTCRMLGYNAPEMRGDERPLGKQAHEKLKALLGDGHVTVTYKMKTDRYGRWLCVLARPDGTNINTAMRRWLEEELQYEGAGKYDHMENAR